MSKRKENIKYFFSVEGDTEKWYLEWLCEQISACSGAEYTASVDVMITKNPVRRVKRLNNLRKIDLWHLSDYESDDHQHSTEFQNTMDNMRVAEKQGKSVKYNFGYSNLAFDLWIVLHKRALNNSLSDRSKYLRYINEIFDEDFSGMSEYKEKENFKRCLKKLSLEDVKNAIHNAETIMERNQQNYRPQEYKRFTYFRENPSLEIHIIIRKMLKDCKVL